MRSPWRANGYGVVNDPVLRRLDGFRHMDAVLDLSDPANPREPEWPAADFIVGNPPFLGDKKMRGELGDEYVDALRGLYVDRIPGQSDLCCYWFERARRHIEEGKCKRAGLLATQGIRGGQNREVLKRIKESGDIFFAESDRPWVLQGANVHVSMVGFDDGSESNRVLDRETVESINANLSAAADITTVRTLKTNAGIAFIGTTKKAPFDIPDSLALELLSDVNPHGIPNSEVIFPYANGMTVTRRDARVWIIDFGEMDLAQASLFERPFEWVSMNVRPLRKEHREPRQREKWWLLARSCPEMQAVIRKLGRFLVTPTVCKHRVFVWQSAPTEPDHQLYVFAREDAYFFGLLQSRVHEVWGLKLGTRLETRPRYTPTTCFETFPFPEATEPQRAAIAAAAELDRLRNNWLNPPEWVREEVLEFPGSVGGPWARYVQDTNDKGVGVVRYPRLVPRDEDCARQLAKRTLTNLYNLSPPWLQLAHRALDEAVFAAYGLSPAASDEAILASLLEMNQRRAKG
jgi:type II restriction/modification system DNA methylase subunit YeeA